MNNVAPSFPLALSHVDPAASSTPIGVSSLGIRPLLRQIQSLPFSAAPKFHPLFRPLRLLAIFSILSISLFFITFHPFSRPSSSPLSLRSFRFSSARSHQLISPLSTLFSISSLFAFNLIPLTRQPGSRHVLRWWLRRLARRRLRKF